FHDPDRLVAGHEGKPGREGAGVLLVVGAAQPARLDSQQPVVVADLGEVELARHQPPGLLQHQGARRGQRTAGIAPIRCNTSRASSTMARTTSPAGVTSPMPPTPWPAG